MIHHHEHPSQNKCSTNMTTMVWVDFGPCKLQVDHCTCGTKWETPCHEVDLCAHEHHSKLDTTKEMDSQCVLPWIWLACHTCCISWWKHKKWQYDNWLEQNMAAINKHSVQHAFIVCCAIVCNTCKLTNCMLHNCNNCMLKCFFWCSIGTPRYWMCNGCSCVCTCNQTTIDIKMHMLLCACIWCVHACASYMCCFNMSWFVSNTNGTNLWQINQNVLLQHPCSTTHVCNFLHTLSMQHALSMH